MEKPELIVEKESGSTTWSVSEVFGVHIKLLYFGKKSDCIAWAEGYSRYTRQKIKVLPAKYGRRVRTKGTG